MAAEISSELGLEATLIKGDKCIFDVAADETVVFSKHKEGIPIPVYPPREADAPRNVADAHRAPQSGGTATPGLSMQGARRAEGHEVRGAVGATRSRS